jgi:energy-coupling factor transporter ATP-binding protein EcfA2
MKKLSVKSFGPLAECEVEFGDLTVLVGPQASGKSLFVQLMKALADAGAIRKTLKQHGFDWMNDIESRRGNYLSIYFGGGMQSLWQDKTEIAVDGKPVDFVRQVVSPPPRATTNESVFLIPAQRVLVLQEGWPRPFQSYPVGDPFCMRNFSDALRRLMEQGLGSGDAIFPQPGRLKAELRRQLDAGVYVGGKLKLETDALRKRVVLLAADGTAPLPFSAWSAGQREFTPLLLGLYWLMPGSKTPMKSDVDTVVIEEPEMGLHPQAILSFCLLMLELLHRGYKVIVSTHSPVVLDVVWALKELRAVNVDRAIAALAKIFKITKVDAQMRELLVSALGKQAKTYYFDRTAAGVIVRDISTLDPGAEDKAVSGWGGLSGFSGNVADAVGDALVEEGLA